MRSLFLMLSFSLTSLALEYINFKVSGVGNVKLPLHTVIPEDQQRLSKSIFYSPSSSIKLPSSHSLKSKFSRPRAQGERGTCSAFTSIGLIEFYDSGGDYSEQCLAWFSREIDSDNISRRLDWALENGLYEEKDCPYFGYKEGRSIIPDLTEKTKFWPSKNYIRVPQNIEDPISFIKSKIVEGNPVGVTFYVAGKDWDKKGIINVPSKKEIDATCALSIKSSKYKKCGKHGAIITGYNDELKYLELRNSWGPGWPFFPVPGDGYG